MSLKSKRKAARKRSLEKLASPAVLKTLVRPALKLRVARLGLKGGAFSVWAIMWIFDVVWHVFIAPFIKKEERELKTKMREKRIKESASGIKAAKTKKDFLNAVKSFYKESGG